MQLYDRFHFLRILPSGKNNRNDHHYYQVDSTMRSKQARLTDGEITHQQRTPGSPILRPTTPHTSRHSNTIARGAIEIGSIQFLSLAFDVGSSDRVHIAGKYHISSALLPCSLRIGVIVRPARPAVVGQVIDGDRRHRHHRREAVLPSRLTGKSSPTTGKAYVIRYGRNHRIPIISAALTKNICLKITSTMTMTRRKSRLHL